MYRYTKITAAAVALATAAAMAYAGKSTENDATSITHAKTSLVQAIATAEQHANGKAAKAEYEQSKGQWIYDVEVVSGTQVFDVAVDADKGTVISSVQDKADRDSEHDEKD